MVLLRCKLAVAGDATSGKTALVNSFVSGPSSYPKNYVMTQGYDLLQKTVSLPYADVEFLVYDLSGQSIYRSQVREAVRPRQLAKTSVVMLVYDVSNRESFDSLSYWLDEVREANPGRAVAGIVVATKTDLTSQYQVSPQEAASFAAGNGFEFFETSAVRATQYKGKSLDLPFTAAAETFARLYDTREREVSQLR
jgi:small GTP-binding protein